MGTGTSNQLGKAGEDAALAAYGALGYRTLARNWRCAAGEIDLVLARGSLLIVCEVKARRGAAFGGPFEAVTMAKQRRLRSLAAAFLQSLHANGDDGSYDVRFDVASVSIDAAGHAAVYVFEDAF